MSDIFERMQQDHAGPSEQLRQAEQIVSSEQSQEQKRKQLYELAKAAPAREKVMFDDLFESLARQQLDDEE